MMYVAFDTVLTRIYFIATECEVGVDDDAPRTAQEAVIDWLLTPRSQRPGVGTIGVLIHWLMLTLLIFSGTSKKNHEGEHRTMQ